MPNRPPVTLPDFRNLGIMLRVVLAAQVLGLAAALLKSPELQGAPSVYLALGTVLQPPLLLCLLALFAASPRLQRMPYPKAAGLAVIIALACGLLWSAILAHAYPEAFPGGVLRTGLLTVGAALAVLAYFNWRHRVLSPALAEARLQALQSRIRPHFLFNTLNTAISLLRSSPAQAETVLEDLAELFRMQMSENDRLSPFARELELARAYAQLEEFRLGERLRLEWKVDNAPMDVLIPPLVLQPLLENAICHGVETSPQGGTVRVDAFARNDQLNVVVRNPLPAEGTRRPGNRMALSNIRERLALHFDAEARLTTHRAGGDFIVQVVMPLRRGR
jgi:two-component system, LytTR family, sensor histidine kinase AlgZ